MQNILGGITVQEICSILIVKSEHRTVPAAKRKINSLPGERTELLREVV